MQTIDQFAKAAAAKLNLGATGEFPLGELGSGRDEGGLKAAIAIHPSGKIIIAFGKKLEWVEFDAAQGRAFVAALTQKIEEAEARTSREKP